MGSACLKRNVFISSLGVMGQIKKQITLFIVAFVWFEKKA